MKFYNKKFIKVLSKINSEFIIINYSKIKFQIIFDFQIKFELKCLNKTKLLKNKNMF